MSSHKSFIGQCLELRAATRDFSAAWYELLLPLAHWLGLSNACQQRIDWCRADAEWARREAADMP